MQILRESFPVTRNSKYKECDCVWFSFRPHISAGERREDKSGIQMARNYSSQKQDVHKMPSAQIAWALTGHCKDVTLHSTCSGKLSEC
jgi:hypothetical protein